MNILITGPTGSMGYFAVKEIVRRCRNINLRLFVLKNDKEKKIIKEFKIHQNVEIFYGDLTNYEDVLSSLKEINIVIHMAAFISPEADYYPELTMKINYGSMKNFVQAIHKLNLQDSIKFVNIGTVAMTGDRLPPIHWGRVGDPIKPSIYDYYAVSKVAAERLLIDSGIKNFVSLRQTGILGKKMAEIDDGIMLHNCLNNVLEYVSDKDSGIMIGNLCKYQANNTLDYKFWGHIYNIGGGESCRIDAFSMYEKIYGSLGFKDLSYIFDPRIIATSNFHGQYYLDSNTLNEYLNFNNDSFDYFINIFNRQIGFKRHLIKFLCKLPRGQKFVGSMLKQKFLKLGRSKNGTVRFIEDNDIDKIKVFFKGLEQWEKIPENINDFKRFKDWDTVIKLDHGYDEEKDKSLLDIDDIKKAAIFRGGKCLNDEMIQGDWVSLLKFECAFSHQFNASPRLILEGGHWCPECERKSWNYSERAKVDPFFAQVWDVLHKGEEPIKVDKMVSEKDV